MRQDLTKTLKDSYGYRREKGNRYVWNALDGKWITKTNAKAAPIFPLSVYQQQLLQKTELTKWPARSVQSMDLETRNVQ